MMEEFAIAERRILRKILGLINDGVNIGGGIIINIINILRKLQILLEKEE